MRIGIVEVAVVAEKRMRQKRGQVRAIRLGRANEITCPALDPSPRRLLGIVPIWTHSLIDRGHMTYSLIPCLIDQK